jgi:hypothetical protein
MSTPTSWRAWAAAAVIFVLGIATGVAGTSLYALRIVRGALQSPPAAGGPADRATARIADDIIRNLELAPPEARRVRAEFAQAAANIRALRAQSNRQMIFELREGARRAAAELPAAQRAAFYNRIERRLQALGLDGNRPRFPEDKESPPARSETR